MENPVILFTLGRIVYGVLLVFMGANHFLHKEEMTKYAHSQGVPFAEYAVMASGGVLIAGAITIIIGFFIKYGVLLIVLFFLPVTFIMHRFWEIEDPVYRTIEMNQFMKNFIIMGAALMAMAITTHTWTFGLMGG